jgi:hypothetical protein
LLFSELNPVFRHLAAALPVLAWGITAPFDGAFGGIAALSLEKKLDAFPAAELTNRTGIPSH